MQPKPPNNISWVNLLKGLRIKNLAIIIVLCVITQIHINTQLTNDFRLPFYSEVGKLTILIAFLVSITLGGYFKNDIDDLEIDIANGKKTNLADLLGKSLSFKFYVSLVFFTLALSFLMAFWYDKWMYWPLVPVTILLLHGYSKRIKTIVFAPNLLVGLLCGLVIFFIKWANEPQYVETAAINFASIHLSLIDIFALFAVLTTILREIVKDCQDIEGDKLFHKRTFPIVNGLSYTHNVLKALLLLLMAIEFFCLLNFHEYELVVGFILGLCFSLIILLLIIKMTNIESKHRLFSALLKWKMILGMMVWLSNSLLT